MQLLLQALVAELADKSTGRAARPEAEGDGAAFLAALDLAGSPLASDLDAEGDDREGVALAALPAQAEEAPLLSALTTRAEVSLAEAEAEKGEEDGQVIPVSSEIPIASPVANLPVSPDVADTPDGQRKDATSEGLVVSGRAQDVSEPKGGLPEDLPGREQGSTGASAQLPDDPDAALRAVTAAGRAEPINSTREEPLVRQELLPARPEPVGRDVPVPEATPRDPVADPSRRAEVPPVSAEAPVEDKSRNVLPPGPTKPIQAVDQPPKIDATPNDRAPVEAQRSQSVPRERVQNQTLPVDGGRPDIAQSVKPQLVEREREPLRARRDTTPARESQDAGLRASPTPQATTLAQVSSSQPQAVVPEIRQRLDRDVGPVPFDADLAVREAGDQLRASVSDRPRPDAPAPRLVVSQIVQSVTRTSADNVIEVKLQPEELGRVRLTMSPSEAGVTVFITAERSETLEMLRRNIDMLADDLGEKGFSNLSFAFAGEGFNQEGREDTPEASTERSAPPGLPKLEVDLSPENAPMLSGRVDIKV